MAARSEQQKAARKSADEKKASEYLDYYSTHTDVVQPCKRCGKSKKLLEFVSSYAHRHTCKVCHRNRVNSWRSSNTAATDKIKAKSFGKPASLIRSFKSRPCGSCKKEYPPYVLDFHHIGPKTAEISRLYEKCPERIAAEISQCQLLCANCHRDESQANAEGDHTTRNRTRRPPIVDVEIIDGCQVKTCGICSLSKHLDNFSVLKSGARHTYCKKCLREYNSKFTPGRKRSTSEYLKSIKDNQPCSDCGDVFRYWVLDFDHIGEKTRNVSQMKGGSLEALQEEISKCELVCANCHRIRTHKLRSRLPSPRGARSKPVHEFDLSCVRVSICSDHRAARSILKRYHYAGVGRPASIVYAAYLQDKIIAVAKLAPVVRVEVATSAGLNAEETLELDRLCVVPDYQVKNLVSKFLSLVIRRLRTDSPHVKALISFADPSKGHDGTVYRASNWKYMGASPCSYEYEDVQGVRIHKKTVYNSARSSGMKEREYAEEQRLTRVPLPPKHKFMVEVK